MKSDKEREHDRYEQRAQAALLEKSNFVFKSGIESLSPILRAPYVCYQAQIKAGISRADMKVLEIGAGTGMFSEMILATGAQLTATDISESSLELLLKRLEGHQNIETRVADMEAMPFPDASFDAVMSAGSLSYGDNRVVREEIYRVLKTGGLFICVDSLNHNPVYRFNRWLQYLRRKRSRSTLERMPTQQLLMSYAKMFGKIDVHYFGSLTWLAPLFGKIIGMEKAAKLSDQFDQFIKVSRSAFKFVMVVEKSNPGAAGG